MLEDDSQSSKLGESSLDIVEAVVQPILYNMEIVVKKSLDIVETVVQQEGYFNERRLWASRGAFL